MKIKFKFLLVILALLLSPLLFILLLIVGFIPIEFIEFEKDMNVKIQ